MLVVLSCGFFCIFCLSLCNELQSSLLILLLLGAPRSFSAIRHPNLRPPSPCWKQQLQTLQLLDSPWTPNFLLGGLGWLRCLLLWLWVLHVHSALVLGPRWSARPFRSISFPCMICSNQMRLGPICREWPSADPFGWYGNLIAHRMQTVHVADLFCRGLLLTCWLKHGKPVWRGSSCDTGRDSSCPDWIWP